MVAGAVPGAQAGTPDRSAQRAAVSSENPIVANPRNSNQVLL
jgi:hypothetical protein